MDMKICDSAEKTSARDILKTDKCDKYDYLIAAACGVIGGIVDIFFVGMPGDSKLQVFTDQQVDKIVMRFAKIVAEPDKVASIVDVASAKDILGKMYKVNYDQSTSASASMVFGISPSNHHMKSLAHSPDIIGLFFSILDQFTSQSHFISAGRLISMNTDTFELKGNSFGAKLFCGVTNWIGHLVSDVAGTGTTKGRGMGLVMPFYELLGLCEFGKFDIKGERIMVNDLATKIYENGYDARFGIATSIPLLITELSIKLVWAIRQRIQYNKPIKECIPMRIHSDLRIMLLIGNGTLCIIDGVDAAVESGGNWVNFFMRLNLVGWCNLIQGVLIEVCIQLGINIDFDAQIEAFQRMNVAMEEYLVLCQVLAQNKMRSSAS